MDEKSKNEEEKNRDDQNQNALSGPIDAGHSQTLDETQALKASAAGHNCELQVISGIAPKSYSISQYPTAVGRLASCPVHLDEPHVSRLHFQLDFNANAQTWFVDNNSAPVLINGKEAQPRQVLNQGDLITVGLVTLRFLLSDGEPTHVMQKSRLDLEAETKARDPEVVRDRFLIRHKREIIWASAIAGIIALTLIIVIVSTGIAVNSQDSAATAAEILDQAEAKYLEGQLSDAQALTAESLEMHSTEAAKKLANTLQKEQARRLALEAAVGLYDRKEYDAAKKELETVTETSIYADRKAELTKKIILDQSESVLNKARKLEQAGHLTKALDLVENFLTQYPNVQTVVAMKDALLAQQQLLADFEKNVLPLVMNLHFEKALHQAKKYDKRGLDEAHIFSKDLKLFRSLYEAGKADLIKRSVDAAEKNLSRAHGMLTKVTYGKSGELTKSLTALYTNSLYLKAFVLKEKGHECQSAELVWQARNISPANSNVHDLAEFYLTKAKRIHAQASQIADIQQASVLAQKGLCLVPADSNMALKLAELVK